MNKTAIGVLCAGALAAAGLLATSYYTGIKIQEAFEQNADDWSSENGFEVEVERYDRGLIRSQAQTVWTFSGEDESYDITVIHDILHGPWPMGKAAKVVSRFQLPEDSEPALEQALKQQAPLEWTTLADWSGATSHAMSSPAFSVTFQDSSVLSWGGLQANWTLSATHTQTEGALRMPLLRVQVEDGSLMNMEDIDLTFNSQLPEGHTFWIGPSTMGVGTFAIEMPDTPNHIRLQDLRIDAENTLQDRLLQSTLDVKLANINATAYSAKNAALQVRFNNIDADWMNQFMLWVQSGYDASNMGWLRNLSQFLAAKPEFSIPHFGMDSSEGPVSLSARLTYTGTQTETFDPAKDLEGQLHATLPRITLEQLVASKVRSDYLALLEQMQHEIDEQELQAAVTNGVQKRLATLVQQGILDAQGTQTQLNLDFSQGQFKLNGHPQTMQQLLSIGNAL